MVDIDVVVPHQDEVKVYVNEHHDIVVSRAAHDWEQTDEKVVFIVIPRAYVQVFLARVKTLSEEGV